MNKRDKSHDVLIRVYMETRAFKSSHPALLLGDLCEAWTSAGRAPGDFATAVSDFVLDGMATWSRIDGEFVIELTQDGVQRAWLLHNPALAARRALSTITGRFRTADIEAREREHAAA